MMGCNTQNGLSPEAFPPLLAEPSQVEESHFTVVMYPPQGPPSSSDCRCIKAWLAPVPLGGTVPAPKHPRGTSLTAALSFNSSFCPILFPVLPLKCYPPKHSPISALLGLFPRGQEQRHRVAFLSYKSYHTVPLQPACTGSTWPTQKDPKE